MKKIRIAYIAAFTLLVFAFLYTTTSRAAAYDIKEDTFIPTLVAAKTVIKAEKVMNGITDLSFNMYNGKEQQKVILQCDSTTETVNVFYYLKDTVGGKATGATGFAITVYGNGDKGYAQNGHAVVFDGLDPADNLRHGLDRLRDLNGLGFIVFEFYQIVDGQGRSPIAFSMMIPSTQIDTILKAIDSIEGSGGCNIPGGFTSVYSLKSLKDSI